MGTVWFSVANSSRGAPPVKAALSSTGFVACDLMKASAARSAKGAGNGLSATGRATADAVMAHSFGRRKTGKRTCSLAAAGTHYTHRQATVVCTVGRNGWDGGVRVGTSWSG